MRALGHAHQHDVHDHDATDEHANRDDGRHDREQHLGELLPEIDQRIGGTDIEVIAIRWSQSSREAHGFLHLGHRGPDLGGLAHLDRNRRVLTTAINRFERRDRHQGKAVERLAEHAAFTGHDADDRVALPHHAHIFVEGRCALKKLLRHVSAHHDHVAPFAHIDVAQGPPISEPIVLHDLVACRHAEDQHAAKGTVAPYDIGLRRGPTGLQRDRQGVGKRITNGLGVAFIHARTALQQAELVVGEQAKADRQPPDLKRVHADHGIGDVLLHVRVHPLDDRHDRHEKAHRHHDAQQGERRSHGVHTKLQERQADDVGEAHGGGTTRAGAPPPGRDATRAWQAAYRRRRR